LATPWKHGFKSAKSIVKISFVEKRPTTFWESLGPEEYGFWANVNPDVPHPRWSQATETFLSADDRPPDPAVQRLWRTGRRSLQGP
jgi:methionine sulfoxide reductase catalytic subunit